MNKLELLEKALKSAKVKLIVKADRRGLYEDFGVRESRKISDEFGYPFRGEDDSEEMVTAVDTFDNWAGNYEG